ncbi:hypothetical protein [Tuwongella immobilis]|uniref:Secreted protein n=1 Tax=Tuwongella immobilis TaxID=692036 RepID=A0A6C2YJ57_9BACT|nr:hypothetical protein [Tuwongella immobilis]VIP01279.1 unnamed protein product [Tuwongella immobilis]VTR97984.1 unnamed protein product [Tuwongella immobilis]
MMTRTMLVRGLCLVAAMMVLPLVGCSGEKDPTLPTNVKQDSRLQRTGENTGNAGAMPDKKK